MPYATAAHRSWFAKSARINQTTTGTTSIRASVMAFGGVILEALGAPLTLVDPPAGPRGAKAARGEGDAGCAANGRIGGHSADHAARPRRLGALPPRPPRRCARGGR